MRSVYSSVLFPLLFALFCAAYPASDSKEMRGEKFARFLAQYAELTPDNSDIDTEERKEPEIIKEGWNPRGITSEDLRADFYVNGIERLRDIETQKELAYGYPVEKRAPLQGAFKYHKCYFNPVTCYGRK